MATFRQKLVAQKITEDHRKSVSQAMLGDLVSYAKASDYRGIRPSEKSFFKATFTKCL